MFLRNLGRVTLAALPLLTPIAHTAWAADAPSDAQLSAARDLFVSAEKDEDAQRWSDALEKLQRVAQVKLTPGIRYHTALCEEHLGRLVAALNDYKAAADQARAENANDVLRLVDRRIADSTERVPRIMIVLVPSLPDATVRLDGQPIAPGEAILADPGTHAIDVSAPGRTAPPTIVTVQEHDTARLEVKLGPQPPPAPALAPAAKVEAPRPEPSPVVPENGSSSKERTVAIVAAATAVGLAAAGFGAYVIGSLKHTDSVQACAQIVSHETDACDEQKNAVRAWDWAGVGAWTAAAAAGSFAVVSLLRLHHEASRVARRGAVRPDGADGETVPSPSARIVLGPGSMGIEGTF
jgi:hypothetical protein